MYLLKDKYITIDNTMNFIETIKQMQMSLCSFHVNFTVDIQLWAMTQRHTGQQDQNPL